MISRFSGRLAGGLLMVAVVLTAGGCNRDKSPGTVAGNVTYNGNSVTAGNLNFVSATGIAASSKIDASGNYSIDAPLQAGEYKVFVTPPVPEPAAPGTKPTALPKFDLPSKFREPGSSGMVVTIKAGKNDIPVQFKD